ncbi:bifunctional K:H/Na:H antiporter NHX1 [Sporobolomyces koalae]|uniref:bifunctional K:H/Na:H antiporter NHX1 n=1 Tax=Sporobolomyces koalae TaxID=500713 RepID=UPI0031707772
MNNPNAGLPGPTSISSRPISTPSASFPPVLDPEVEELWSSRALLLVLFLLVLSFWVSYYLKVRRIRSIHETLVAMFAGMCVGAIVRIAPGHVVQSMIAFKSTILLNVLLPPIILNSGYQLKQENFFRNFGVILTFAFAGTFISAVALGVIVYLYSLLGLEGLSLTIVECLLFGSTLSATDPVTILAIFNALHVDPKLYSVIFGESILNDAVAIVMFETLSQFHGEKISLFSFFHGVGIFLLTFCISMALGVMFGLACSLMLKHSELGRFTEIEACLVLLIAYTSYFFSNALTMSGIVSLLFCGITLKHYAYHNMSHRTQRTTRYMFGTLAQLSENFIFIYLGLSLFTMEELVYKPMFIIVTGIAVCIARYCAVFPISKLLNIYFRARGSRSDELPHSYQMMLFWAGLRGAVGVALAAGMKGDHAVALRTTVLVAVVLTVIVFGGTIGRMIEILGIRTGVDEGEDGDESSDEEGYGLIGSGSGEAEEEGRRYSKRRSMSFGKKSSGPRERDWSTDAGSNGDGYSNTSGSGDSPYRDELPLRSSSTLRLGSSARRGGSHSGGVGPGAAGRTSRFGSVSAPTSDLSASSSDSDPDILPSAQSTLDLSASSTNSSKPSATAEGSDRVWRDGQWFTVLDERYLLPVFSNATASRKQATKKALMKAKRSSFAVDRSTSNGDLGHGGGDDSFEGGSPYLGGGGGHHQVNPSFSDILSSLVGPALSSSSSAPASQQSTNHPLHPKRRDSFSSPSSTVLDLTPSASSYNVSSTPLASSDIVQSASSSTLASGSHASERRPSAVAAARNRGSVSGMGAFANQSQSPNAGGGSGDGNGTSAPVLPFSASTRRTGGGAGSPGGSGLLEFDSKGSGGSGR